MKLIFILSFIVSGLFCRNIIFAGFSSVSEILLIVFVAVTIYQYLYIFIFSSRDDDLGFRVCLSKWVLYYTFTLEAAVIITYILEFTYLNTMIQHLLVINRQPHDTFTVPLVMSLCISYQILYFVIKSLMNRNNK
ncbi:MAG: hypothetical protein FWE60_05800 [Oscillospiraceae bacterium]|nr:hypothetical protein [Oscillospiraceae bacterium]